MKVLINWLMIVLTLVIVPVISMADDESEREALKKAWQEGAEAQITFQVVDEQGQPIENAQVSAQFYKPWKKSKGNLLDGDWDSYGNSDAKGQYVATGRSAVDMFFRIRKEGCYDTRGTYMLGQSKPKIVDGRWQPWNPTFKVLLREKKNPVAMYVETVNTKIPVREKPVGYDLTRGDWVMPYGKGEVADFVITVKGKNISHSNCSDCSMDITFSNKGDGIQFFGELPYEGYRGKSDFFSPYLAPEDGYLSSWDYGSYWASRDERYLRNRQLWLQNLSQEIEVEHRQIHFFRVRTELDSYGKVVKALYGKIQGEISLEFKELVFHFTYYLNPDGTRNMEHIPGRTLFKAPWMPSPKK